MEEAHRRARDGREHVVVQPGRRAHRHREEHERTEQRYHYQSYHHACGIIQVRGKLRSNSYRY